MTKINELILVIQDLHMALLCDLSKRFYKSYNHFEFSEISACGSEADIPPSGS